MACVSFRRGKWVVDYRDENKERRWVTCESKEEADLRLEAMRKEEKAKRAKRQQDRIAALRQRAAEEGESSVPVAIPPEQFTEAMNRTCDLLQRIIDAMPVPEAAKEELSKSLREFRNPGEEEREEEHKKSTRPPTELALLRKQTPWTQKEFAERLGITANHFARVERGESALQEPVAKLARILVDMEKKGTHVPDDILAKEAKD